MKLYEHVYLDDTAKVEAVVRGLRRELAELKELVRDESLHTVAKNALMDETYVIQSLITTFENLLRPTPPPVDNEIPF